MLQRIETALPDWFWSPQDEWSRYKGFGRIFILIAILTELFTAEFSTAATLPLFIALLLYGTGLLGMRMDLEGQRKGGNA